MQFICVSGCGIAPRFKHFIDVCLMALLEIDEMPKKENVNSAVLRHL